MLVATLVKCFRFVSNVLDQLYCGLGICLIFVGFHTFVSVFVSLLHFTFLCCFCSGVVSNNLCLLIVFLGSSYGLSGLCIVF